MCMCMHMYMSETTATFFAKHELWSSYTAAFDEHGWDSLPALQETIICHLRPWISDDDFS
jgi:hypothetical protein